jgi:hypothetical protein
MALYGTNSLYVPGHLLTAAVLRTAIKETHCVCITCVDVSFLNLLRHYVYICLMILSVNSDYFPGQH